MNITGAITTIDVAGVRVAFHTPHEDGSSSYRVEHDNEHVTVYLHGTPEQLGAFADAVCKAVSDRAIAEVEAASLALRKVGESPIYARMAGTERWCFACSAWVADWHTHAHADRIDSWHPANVAELAQRDRATFTERPAAS